MSRRLRNEIGFLGQLSLVFPVAASRLGPRINNWKNNTITFGRRCNALKNSSASRRRKKGGHSQFEQFPHFGLADKDDEDEEASQDIDDIDENPVSEIAVDQEGDGLRHPRHAHQKEKTEDHSKSR